MPKRTVLDMTQDILRHLSLDDCDSITDHDDALRVAHIIKNTFFDLTANRQIPEHEELFQLTALGDSSKPTIMQIPDNIEELCWIKYDKRNSSTDTRNRFQTVEFMDPTQFITMSNGRDSTDTTNYGTQTDPVSGITLIYKKTANPQYWTTFDDDYVFMDSLDTTIDSTLQASKIQAYGKVEPTFTVSDTFTPDIDANLFPLLYNASRAVASIDLNKEASPSANASARGQIISSQNNRHRRRASNKKGLSNYGRH